MLVTVSEQCDQKIMAIRDDEKQGSYSTFLQILNVHLHMLDCFPRIRCCFFIAMVELKNENKRLYKRVDDLREEQLSLQSQVPS